MAKSITVLINGVDKQLEGTTILTQLLKRERADSLPATAVALNGRVITRSLWAVTEVNDGDNVLIIQAAQGG